MPKPDQILDTRVHTHILEVEAEELEFIIDDKLLAMLLPDVGARYKPGDLLHLQLRMSPDDEDRRLLPAALVEVTNAQRARPGMANEYTMVSFVLRLAWDGGSWTEGL